MFVSHHSFESEVVIQLSPDDVWVRWFLLAGLTSRGAEPFRTSFPEMKRTRLGTVSGCSVRKSTESDIWNEIELHYSVPSGYEFASFKFYASTCL